MPERVEIKGCEFPESGYEATSQDGSRLILKIIRTPRIKGEPDPSQSCAVADQINKGEFDPGIAGIKICGRCNTAFSIVAGIIRPEYPPIS